MFTKTNNRLVQVHIDQKMAAATLKFLGHFTSLPVGSQVMTPDQIVQLFTDRAAAAQAVQAATAARAAAVVAHREKRALTGPTASAFRRIVQGMFAHSPDTLAEFGLTPLKAPKKSAATKAEAAVKNVATRKARHTMGANQKKAIRGTATPAPATSTSVGTAPAPKTAS
jgi:hypothetical protein